MNAEFCPPAEKLAYAIQLPGEADLPEIWPEPLAIVVETLQTYKSYLDVWDNLPDILLIN